MPSLSSVLLASSIVTSALSLPGNLVARQSASANVVATATVGATVPTASVAAAVQGCVGVNTGGATYNDIVNGLPCKAFTLIFARGTFESGNIGGIVGPPFVAALNARIGAANVAVQGVNDYPADVAGFNAGGSATGSTNMAALIEQTMTQCPNTKLCVSGYSQGAQVAHNAADMISANATAFINSAVLWGDPDLGEAFGSVPASKVSTDCHLGDDICLGGNLILPPHLDYCRDAGMEADFAISQAGL
ncbi:hypothetical protein PMZ80_000368 [Knufia obscura]|uniref:cutinase n=1 Tax=Knufia obscura TaxID=1635080 RepID=A0ABR0S018_9EURO|nr:hypothetical protein PMZ80_000368 [Knufia obscura]